MALTQRKNHAAAAASKKDQTPVQETSEQVGKVTFESEEDDMLPFAESTTNIENQIDDQVEETIQEETIQEESIVVVKSQEANPTTEHLMSREEVEALLRKQREDFAAEMDARMKKLLDENSKAVRKSEIAIENKSFTAQLLDDYLEVPVVFFAYSSDFFIGGDFRNGREILPPSRDEKVEGKTGIIRFEQVVRQIRRTERSSAKVICISAYKCHSKAEAEFLENHSLFGVRFFKEMDTTKTIDSKWATKLTEANNALAKLDDHGIIQKCADYGIPRSTNVQEMRRKLINMMAQSLIAQEEKLMTEKATDLYSGFDVSGDGSMRKITPRNITV